MDHDILALVRIALFRTHSAMRRGRLEEAERWTRVSERNAALIGKLLHGRDIMDARAAHLMSKRPRVPARMKAYRPRP
ncbi:MAG: hypothetical protein JNM47_05015 [Hyphomonadaceae bacterium]|nr:hypothetical protein [Hyphomonadaceae bacterium]